jgi:hypothetical protein
LTNSRVAERLSCQMRRVRASPSISRRQRGVVLVRFLHQQRSARRRAAVADALRFKQRNAQAGVRKAPCDRRSSDAAADVATSTSTSPRSVGKRVSRSRRWDNQSGRPSRKRGMGEYTKFVN